jgi:hypothetical protein
MGLTCIELSHVAALWLLGFTAQFIIAYSYYKVVEAAASGVVMATLAIFIGVTINSAINGWVVCS